MLSNKMEKRLLVPSHLNNLVKSITEDGPIVLFADYEFNTFISDLKSQSKESFERPKEFTDYEKYGARITSLRHNQLLGSRSHWNKVEMADSQNALFEEKFLFQKNTKIALVYGRQRLFYKDLNPKEDKPVNSNNYGAQRYSDSTEPDIYSAYFRRLSYLLKHYGIERAYITDPQFI